MRISDWSSDVCSSDLDLAIAALQRVDVEPFAGDHILNEEGLGECAVGRDRLSIERLQLLHEAGLAVEEQSIGLDTLERGQEQQSGRLAHRAKGRTACHPPGSAAARKSTRLNSNH